QHRVPYRQNRQRTSSSSLSLLVAGFSSIGFDDAYKIARHGCSLSASLSNFIPFDASGIPEVANRHPAETKHPAQNVPASLYIPCLDADHAHRKGLCESDCCG